jgi:hypothetical protein
MSDRKAVIKNADMSEDMQQDAVDCATQVSSPSIVFLGVRRRVSKRVEDGHMPSALRAGHPRNVSFGVGRAGPHETLGSPWPPLPIRPWMSSTVRRMIM